MTTEWDQGNNSQLQFIEIQSLKLATRVEDKNFPSKRDIGLDVRIQTLSNSIKHHYQNHGTYLLFKYISLSQRELIPPLF